MSTPKTILVFTGGGLAPALNPTLYGVIKTAQDHGLKILGGMFGWASLLANGKVIDLTNVDVSAIQNIGGTFLRSSRTNPYVVPGGVEQIKQKMADLNIDCLVAIGGNDTTGTAARLYSEEGIKIVGVPKTVDNDLSGTYFTPGFATAAKCLAEFVSEIKKDAAYTLSRIFVIESIGMAAGWLTAAGAYGDADVIIPPEKKVSLDKTLQLIAKRYEANKNFAVIVVAQEAKFDQPLGIIADDQADQYKTLRSSYICLSLKDKIKSVMGHVTVKALYPGNFIQTGNPIALDRDLGQALGQKAVELLLAEKYGLMANLVRPDEQSLKLEVSSTPLANVTGYRQLPDDYFDWDNLQVTDNFFHYMEPILGKYQKSQNDPYYQLISKING